MDVDKLFKLPSVPQSSVNKRKWAEPSSSALKAAHVQDVDEQEGQRSNGGSSSSTGNSKRTRVTDIDESDDSGHEGRARRSAYDEDAEGEEGPSFAPGNDADYFIEEDDEGGRFFGGGLTAQQKRILELMNQGGGRATEAGDGARDEDDEGLSPEQELKNLRRALLRLERAITKNQELRARYSDDPQRFIESEADLHDSIRALVVVTTNPALLYPEVIKQGIAASLCGLLTHENVDVSASAIELMEEMTDDDVLDAGLEGRSQEQQEEGVRRGQLAVENVLDALLENSLVDLLIQTLPRLEHDESKAKEQDSAVAEANAESDAATLYHVLGLVENIVSLRSSLADVFLGNKAFRDWLLTKILPATRRDQNKHYAGELISILLQAGSSEETRARSNLLGKEGTIDSLLEALSPLRKRVPYDGEEREFTENLFDSLCVLLEVPRNKVRFSEAEGIELMCLIMKVKGFARLRALKVASHACSGTQGAQNASRFVDMAGLKYLFSTFMRGSGSEHIEATAQDEAGLLELTFSLLNNLASGSLERMRLISKFVDSDYEKIDRLVEMRSACRARLHTIEVVIKQESLELPAPLDVTEQEERALDAYLRKLDGGLYDLQLIDYILAWLIMEDDGIQAHVRLLLERSADDEGYSEQAPRDLQVSNGGVHEQITASPYKSIIVTLQEYYDNVDENILVAEAESANEEPLHLRDVIVQLVNYLLSL